MLFKTSGGVLEDVCENILGYGDGSSEAHVAARRVDFAFGDVGEHWCDEGVSQPLRYLSGLVFYQVIVFPDDHVRTILLGATGWNNDGGFTLGDGVTDLHPGEFFNEDAIRNGYRGGLRK